MAILPALLAAFTSLHCRKTSSSDDGQTTSPGDAKAAELTVGPYRIAIPAGWRDMAEIPDLPPATKLGPGSAGIMPETVGGGDFTANIMFIWAPLPAGTVFPKCKALAHEVARGMRSVASDIVTLQIEGAPGCRWRITNDDAAGVHVVRFQGDHEFIIQCLRSLDGDDAADRACEQVVNTLRLAE